MSAPCIANVPNAANHERPGPCGALRGDHCRTPFLCNPDCPLVHGHTYQTDAEHELVGEPVGWRDPDDYRDVLPEPESHALTVGGLARLYRPMIEAGNRYARAHDEEHCKGPDCPFGCGDAARAAKGGMAGIFGARSIVDFETYRGTLVGRVSDDQPPCCTSCRSTEEAPLKCAYPGCGCHAKHCYLCADASGCRNNLCMCHSTPDNPQPVFLMAAPYEAETSEQTCLRVAMRALDDAVIAATLNAEAIAGLQEDRDKWAQKYTQSLAVIQTLADDGDDNGITESDPRWSWAFAAVKALSIRSAALQKDRGKWEAIANDYKATAGMMAQQCEEWRRKAESADLALQSLTPGGSEYVDDPAACAKFVREVRDRQHAQILKHVMGRRRAEKLHTLLTELVEGVTVDVSTDSGATTKTMTLWSIIEQGDDERSRFLEETYDAFVALLSEKKGE